MLIIGIDPGASGGIAFNWLGSSFAYKMPETEADVKALLISEIKGEEAFVYMEEVHSMPKQGVKSTFTFGTNYGFLRGLLAGLDIPREFVTPNTWQKAMRCLSKGDKNITKKRAQELFPKLSIIHATADALLIAEYGRRLRAGEFSK